MYPSLKREREIRRSATRGRGRAFEYFIEKAQNK